ncbi:MAG TPA: hypothetical protein VFS54_01205 [Solirubrobacterales bacterium]|nr:hypothetical protein [Solirubrobacterales bacterium]
MNCPRCLVENDKQSRTQVRETRPERSDGQSAGVRRRRRCAVCGYRFTTIERPKAASVRLGDGQTETFDEERLLRSLQRSTAGAELLDKELREAAELVRWDLESHRGSVTPANIAQLALGRLPRIRTSARKLYRERTPSLIGGDEGGPPNGVVEKRWPRDEERVLEPFDRRKLLTSVELVAHRRIDEGAIVDLVDRVESMVGTAAGPVATAQIRQWVADGLMPLDQFVYLRVLTTAPDADLESLRRAAGKIQDGLVWRQKVGTYEQFSRDKLVASIGRVTAGRDAVSEDEIRDFANQIGGQVRASLEPVRSDQIEQWVLDWLREHDPVAFISSLAVRIDSPSDLARALRGEVEQEAD